MVPGQQHREQQRERGDGGEALLAAQRAPVAPDARERAGHAATRPAEPAGIEVCGAIPAGHCMRRRYGYLPESRAIAGHGGGDALPCPRAPVQSRCRARCWPSARWRWSPSRRPSSSSSAARRRRAPSEALDPFVAAWSRGDDRGAAALTSDPAGRRRRAGGQPPRPRRRPRAREHARTSPRSGDTRARDRASCAGTCPGSARGPTARASRCSAATGTGRSSGRPTVVHPRLTAGRRLGTVRDPDARAPILDRQGRPLVSARAVVRVGIDRATVKRHRRERDRAGRRPRRRRRPRSRAPPSRAGPKQFVEAVTLRASDYPSRWPSSVEAIQGAQAVPGTAQLAPSRSVRPRAARRRRPGHRRADQALEGQGRRRRRRRPVGPRGALPGPAGRHADAPHRHPRSRTRRARRDAAAAARAARGASCARRSTATSSRRPRRRSATPRQKSALVAVQPSTGDILAVANRPDRRRPTTARSTAATPRARRSRSSPPRRCCAPG